MEKPQDPDSNSLRKTPSSRFLGQIKSLRWGALVALAMALISIYPNLLLWYERSPKYNGFYGLQQYDEDVYAGYINALVLGYSRRSDPLQCGTTSDHESLFSIQFVPAYLIALPTRGLAIRTTTAFLLLSPLLAFLSILALYVLINAVTHDRITSAGGAICVLCFGTIVAGEGFLGHLLGRPSDFHGLFFLRRYLPAVPFPLFFLFCTLTWRSFTIKSSRLYSIGAGAVLVMLIFSYWYLWTAAFAWVCSFTLIWMVVRPQQRPFAVKKVLPILVCGGVASLFYFRILEKRPSTWDQVVALEATHSPDLFRTCELFTIIIALLLLLALKKKYIELGAPITIFILSLLTTIIVVFNQQIFTGLSLQPYHYEFYIANYLTILAGVLTTWILLGQAIRISRILFVGLFALSWGFGELMYSANIHHKKNVQRDELMAATTTIQEPGLVYSRDIAIVNNNISTFSPLSVLWGLHTQVCVGLTPDEGRNRFYHFSYFAGYTPDMLKRSLLEKDYYTTAALFGYERAGGSRLLESRKPIQNDEIDQAVGRYADYIRAFDFAKATQPEIRYVITTPNAPEYPSRLDQWYERVEGKQFGGFTVYRIEPRAISGERGGESHPRD